MELLADLRCLYATDEEIIATGLGADVAGAVVRTAFGHTFAGLVAGGQVRFAGIPAGTHTVELYGADDRLIAEELIGVRDDPGQDPIAGFATSFDAASVPSTLAWLRRLRCTVVQVYDWMERYSTPLGPMARYRDPLGREIDRGALAALVAGIRRAGAVAQAYAPVAAADRGADAQWRLNRNDGAPESLGDLLDIMDPGSPAWQRQWIERYGTAADVIGFNGFHLDTYGYPRGAVDADGDALPLAERYASFIRAVRAARPHDVISFNQVNGVPAGIEPPDPPGFRYVEVWPPNDRWRHLEALMARSAGRRSRPRGDTLAIYPPVWSDDRGGALRTVVLTEAIATMLGAGTMMLGDAGGVLRHPYYVDHERLAPDELETVLAWHRFGLRCRDLFKQGADTSWCELDDENAAVTVSAAAPARPEPVAESLFVRVLRSDKTLVVSLLDLTGSRDGSWSGATAPGTCARAEVTALVDRPDRWRAQVAVLGRAGGRFAPLDLREGPHREGRAVICAVPIATGWSVLRLEKSRKV
ncbi:MAG: hypothetical protein KGL16_03370 [Acidobacteriota bacterium]|nr:hypothetical protein [Acidobacteriota bacterium]